MVQGRFSSPKGVLQNLEFRGFLKSLGRGVSQGFFLYSLFFVNISCPHVVKGTWEGRVGATVSGGSGTGFHFFTMPEMYTFQIKFGRG